MSQRAARFRERIARFGDDSLELTRVLALYSAAVALADETAMTDAINLARKMGAPRVSLHEIVLQSYLFLGFPRMLGAGETLHAVWPAPSTEQLHQPNLDVHSWKQHGEELYSRVYGDNAVRLRERVMSFAPEIFDWMVVEGYGKVLSRPQLDLVTRELSIVAFLMVDNRPKQLMSHLRGAARVGATSKQIHAVIDDLKDVAIPAHAESQQMLVRLGLI